MSPSSKMGDEVEWQRWEFRRRDNDIDSSSDESKSSSEATLKKHKLVSTLISLDSDEAIDNCRVQQNGMRNLCTKDPIMFGKKKRVHRRSQKDDLANSHMERASHKEVGRKKCKTSTFEPAALDDVKIFMDSLLEDLKVTRENLFSWMKKEMQKLVVDDNAPRLARREGSLGGKNVRLQKGDNFVENTSSKECIQVHNKRKFDENILIQHQHNFEKNVLVQHESSEENLCGQHHNNFKEMVQVHHQNNFEEVNVQVHCGNNFESGMRAQKCDIESLGRTVKSNTAAGYDNCYNVLKEQADNSQANRPLIPREKLGSFVKPNFQSCSTDKNVQMQHPKNYLLGTTSLTHSSRSLEIPLKGQKMVQSKNFHPVIEHRVDCVQEIGSITSSEMERGERLGLSIESTFPSNLSSQVASSMYLTLPTVLNNPCGENHMLNTSSCNYIQQTVAGNKLGVNSWKANPMLKVNGYNGKFSGMQQEERNGSFAQIGSRNVSCFDKQIIPGSSIGTGFPVPLYQGMDIGFSTPSQPSLEYLPREKENVMGMRKNEGVIRFSGGSHAIPEDYVVNNFCSHSISQAHGRLQAFQNQNLEEDHLFPK